LAASPLSHRAKIANARLGMTSKRRLENGAGRDPLPCNSPPAKQPSPFMALAGVAARSRNSGCRSLQPSSSARAASKGTSACCSPGGSIPPWWAARDGFKLAYDCAGTMLQSPEGPAAASVLICSQGPKEPSSPLRQPHPKKSRPPGRHPPGPPPISPPTPPHARDRDEPFPAMAHCSTEAVMPAVLCRLSIGPQAHRTA